VAESRVTRPILFDGGTTKFSHPIATRYGVTRIPQKVVEGRDGKVVSIHLDLESVAKNEGFQMSRGPRNKTGGFEAP
jgi:hypothetical protein